MADVQHRAESFTLHRLVVTNTLGGKCFTVLHFQWGTLRHTEVESFTQVSHLVNGRAEIQTLCVSPQSPDSGHSDPVLLSCWVTTFSVGHRAWHIVRSPINLPMNEDKRHQTFIEHLLCQGTNPNDFQCMA